MTIEIPTPPADLIYQIETATIETNQTEVAAIAAIREKFGPYAKHNGFIRIAYSYAGNSNYSREDEQYYLESNKKVRGLLVVDEFGKENYAGDQNRGEYTGYRIYLTQTGEWLKIKRSGSWSQWQGEGEGWGCGCSATDSGEYDEQFGGYVKTLSDEQMVGKLEDVLEGLGRSMSDMSEKLPERYAKLKARAELAQRVMGAAKSI